MAWNPKFRIMAGFRILNILNVRNPLTLGSFFVICLILQHIKKLTKWPKNDTTPTQSCHIAAAKTLQRHNDFESRIIQRRLDLGKETPEGFFQVRSQKEYQNVVIISFVDLEKINIFCFMYIGVAQKLSLPRPLEN